jgi:hypothetical protein
MTTALPATIQMARFTKMVRSTPTRTIGVLQKGDGSFTNTPHEAIDVVSEKAFPDSTLLDFAEFTSALEFESEVEGSYTYGPVPWMEKSTLRRSLAQFKRNKSAGPDGFKPLVLQQLPDLALKRLRQLYEASYYSGFVPNDWLKSKVVFLPKPGKDNYALPGSYRPISLTSFLFKNMERVIYFHLLETSLKDNPLSPRQHAFRPGYSTDSALSMTVGKIERGILRKKGLSLALFLDIAGAFDNLSTSYAAKSMLNRGFDPKIVKWYSYYLNNRTCSVTIKGVTRNRSLRRGVPQGGILSPLCWNIAVDELLKLFDDVTDDEQVLLNAYADDLVLIVNGTDQVVLFLALQNALFKVQAWALEAGLTVSPSKSEAVLFTHCRKFAYPPNVLLDGVALVWKDSVKYLGLWLDRGLNWSLHMTKKLTSCRKLLMQLRGSLGSCGAQPHI